MPTPAAGTTAPTTEDATAYLVAHGFTAGHGTGWYEHTTRRARVEIADADAACFIVYAFTGGWLLRWHVQLHSAPLAVFVATVTAALA
jgi:hypothetical protein